MPIHPRDALCDVERLMRDGCETDFSKRCVPQKFWERGQGSTLVKSAERSVSRKISRGDKFVLRDRGKKIDSPRSAGMEQRINPWPVRLLWALFPLSRAVEQSDGTD